MTVYVFGNPDLAMDALPIRLVPRLRERFPGITFEIKDPHEEWDVPERLVVLDTVLGIDGMKVFSSLDAFQASPRVSLHDYDALTQLRFLQKLGKLHGVTVIGLSPSLNEAEAFDAVCGWLVLDEQHRSTRE